MATPEVFRDIASLRARLHQVRGQGKRIALVPTMGALHAGHAELLRVAGTLADFVVATIFVNPLQFDRKEDLDNYPQTFDDDLRICARQRTHLVFAPTPSELYPSETLTFVESPMLSAHLCGAFRPGHFRGVATVVLKLFNIVQPHIACFGEKDAQQLAIIRRMVNDLNVPVAVVPVPTIREADGLALSSRNKHLSKEEREIAPALYRALQAAVAQLDAGETNVAAVKQMVHSQLQSESAIRLEYFELVHPDTLAPLEVVSANALLAAAIWLGSTRLIDNITWQASTPATIAPA